MNGPLKHNGIFNFNNEYLKFRVVYYAIDAQKSINKNLNNYLCELILVHYFYDYEFSKIKGFW